MRLSWLFVILPIIEIALFIQVGGLIGVLPTLGLVFLSAFVGVWIMRMQGRNAMVTLQQSFQGAGDPSAPMAHGALIMMGAGMLIIPGFFTDFVGILLLIPAVRSALLKRFSGSIRTSSPGFGYPNRGPRADYSQDDSVIDGDYVVQDDPPPPVREGLSDHSQKPGNSGWTRH